MFIHVSMRAIRFGGDDWLTLNQLYLPIDALLTREQMSGNIEQ